MPITVTRTAASYDRELKRAKDAAVATVNAAISKKRLDYITDMPGQDVIYKEKETEAVAYLAEDPEPETLDGYVWLPKEVGSTADTPYQLAQLWVNMAALWRLAGPYLEGIRQEAINDISVCTTEAEIEAAMVTFAGVSLDLP